jgi:glycerophosphoryl diester phosphodiesterase
VRARTLDELREVAPQLPTLDEALEFFAGEPSVGVHVDVKCEGREVALADVIRRHGLVDRTLASSFSGRSLLALAQAEPRLARGFTYPNDRYGIARRRPLLPLAHGAAAVLRATLPHRVARVLDAARASAAMLHYSVLSRAVVERCHAHGAGVFGWTINDRAQAEWAASIGVDGVISDDPRLLAGLH